MSYLKACLGTVLLLSLCVACDRPHCENDNPVFNRSSPQSAQYRDELAKQLAMSSERSMRYWFDSYDLKDGNEYITVDVHGHGLCAKAFVLVDDWSGLEGIRKTKGMGYHGAELSGFKMTIRRDSSGAVFVYSDVDSIID